MTPNARVAGAAYERWGARNFAGHYPVHFHLVGEAPLAYVRNNAFYKYVDSPTLTARAMLRRNRLALTWRVPGPVALASRWPMCFEGLLPNVLLSIVAHPGGPVANVFLLNFAENGGPMAHSLYLIFADKGGPAEGLLRCTGPVTCTHSISRGCG